MAAGTEALAKDNLEGTGATSNLGGTSVNLGLEGTGSPNGVSFAIVPRPATEATSAKDPETPAFGAVLALGTGRDPRTEGDFGGVIGLGEALDPSTGDESRQRNWYSNRNT